MAGLPISLDEARLVQAALELGERDPRLAGILAAHGPPPLWQRPAGFATLVHIILEQQVSLASARAAFMRLRDALGEISPAGFLTLDDAQLKAIGFSRQKTAYGRILASAVLSGELDLPALAGLPDDDVQERLTRLKGIGRWTAEIYLMEALLRPDVWPAGDLALANAVRRVLELESTPGPQELHQLGEAWRPWRSVAARLFWHYYLGGVNPFGS